ncbi:MAG: LEA type 2 family protein [Spirochaetia bacterium]|nr:LEA type 2 family protein [Spirochaetia bacterium]
MKKLIILIFILFVSGCKTLAETVFTEPTIQIEDVTITDLALSGVSLDITFSIDNPNSIGLTLKKFLYKFYIEDEKMVESDKEEPLIIEGNSKTTQVVPITIKFSGLEKGITGILNKDELKYAYAGFLTLDTPVGDMMFDLETEGEISMPRPPVFTIEKVNMKEMGLASATIAFHVKIENNDTTSFEVRNFDYLIEINDYTVSEGEENVTYDLDKGKTMTIEIPVNLKLLGLKRSVLDVIESGNFDYHFKFNLELDSSFGVYEIPYEKEGSAELY